MRIQTAADALLPALDTASSHDEATDKHLFARLLQAQPHSGEAVPDTASQLHGAAKAHSVLPSGEVNPASAKSTTKPDAEKTMTVTPAAAKSVVAATSTSISATTVPATAAPAQVAPAIIATGETTKAAELADPATDAQPESADEKTAKPVTTLLANAGNPQDAPALLNSAPTQSSPTAAAPAPENPAATTPRPTLMPNAVLSPALEKNTVNSNSLAESNHKPVAEPADKSTRKSRSARDVHAPVAPVTTSTDTQIAATTLLPADTNAGPQSQTQPATKDDTVRTTGDTHADTALLSTAAPAPTAASNPAMTVPYLPADAALAAGQAVGSDELAALRGTKLPPGGKSLPPPTEQAEASNPNPLLHAVREFADPASSQNPLPAADSSVLQASQNLLSAAAANLSSQDAGAAQQAANSAGTVLSTLSAGTASMTATLSNPAQAPLALAAGLAMTSSSWGEATVQHIRWMKDHDQQSAEIQLHPAELGRLSISIDIKDGQASVQLMAGNAEARDLLEKSLPDLRNLLAQSGMSLTDSGVAQHSGGQQAWPNRFNQAWFADDAFKPLELTAGKPALFRSAGGSHRIDQYV